MYVHVCIYMYMYIYTCIYTCIYIYTLQMRHLIPRAVPLAAVIPYLEIVHRVNSRRQLECLAVELNCRRLETREHGRGTHL
jgi:hypothetical protein